MMFPAILAWRKEYYTGYGVSMCDVATLAWSESTDFGQRSTSVSGSTNIEAFKDGYIPQKVSGGRKSNINPCLRLVNVLEHVA